MNQYATQSCKSFFSKWLLDYGLDFFAIPFINWAWGSDILTGFFDIGNWPLLAKMGFNLKKVCLFIICSSWQKIGSNVRPKARKLLWQQSWAQLSEDLDLPSLRVTIRTVRTNLGLSQPFMFYVIKRIRSRWIFSCNGYLVFILSNWL